MLVLQLLDEHFFERIFDVDLERILIEKNYACNIPL